MIVLKRIGTWTDDLRPFIQKFILTSYEHERTEEQIVRQIKFALVNPHAAIWMIIKDKIPFGYIFVEIKETEYNSTGIVINQMYVDPKYKFKSWKEMARILFQFGEDAGVIELFFLTRRHPNAFIRVLNDGWEIESFVLRKKKENVPHGTNGHAPAQSRP